MEKGICLHVCVFFLITFACGAELERKEYFLGSIAL